MATRSTKTDKGEKEAAPKAAKPKAAAPARAKAPKAAKAPEAATAKAPKAAKAAQVAPEAPVPRPEPTHDEIARRAYELWLSRGGAAHQNWLDAEAELRGC
jgi:hypothetical protein